MAPASMTIRSAGIPIARAIWLRRRERRLVRRHDVGDIVLVDPDDRRVRLDVAGVLARRPELVLEDAGRPGEHRLDVVGAAAPDEPALDVRVGDGGPRPAEVGVAPGVGVEDGRRVAERGVEVEQGLELLDVDLDRGDRGLGRLGGVGGDGGEAVADEADAIPGEDRRGRAGAARSGLPRGRLRSGPPGRPARRGRPRRRSPGSGRGGRDSPGTPRSARRRPSDPRRSGSGR